MAVYFITGKLGNGKTLAGVYQIQRHLRLGLPVATNIDINVCKMVGNDKKNTLVYRLKDKPTVHDLACIGDAYKDPNQKYDESKFGALVFDECATWFNSRTWNDSDRQDLINALVHIRKKHWNVYFIIQNISVVDKQARELLGEHTVFMRRSDNFKIPFVTSIIKLLTGYRLTMPKRFFGIVKYGTNANSMSVDTWYFTGTDIYDLYETEQVFTPLYDKEPYCLLTPYHLKGYSSAIKNWRFTMRLTKIYFKKFNKSVLLALGIVTGVFSGLVFSQAYESKNSIVAPVENLNKVITSDNNESSPLLTKISNKETDFINDLFLSFKPKLTAYVFFNDNMFGRIEFYKGQSLNQVLSFKQLKAFGWSLNMKHDVLFVSKNEMKYTVLLSPDKSGSSNSKQAFNKQKPVEVNQPSLINKFPLSSTTKT